MQKGLQNLIRISIVLLLLFPNLEAKSTNPKIVQADINGRKTEILDKTLWVRLKANSSIESKSNSIQTFTEYSLTPILPQTRINSIQKRQINRVMPKTAGENVLFQSEDLLARTFILEYNNDKSPILYSEYLKRNYPEIEIAEPYYVYDIQSSANTPNDPLLSEQSTLERMQVQTAWQAGLTGDPSMVIIISDNGFNTAHEDLKDNIAYNTAEIPNNGIDDDSNGYIDDYAGYNFSYVDDGVQADNVYHSDSHGTNVAAIASADTDNGIGIAGVGNQCRYFPLKTSLLNSNKIAYGYQSIIYAAENNYKVINCSWGRVKPFSQIEQDIINYAINKGLSIVAASGNTEGSIIREDIFYPANYDGVLGVGEVNSYDYITLDNTTLSLQTKIMAVGVGNYSANNSSNNNEYATLGPGTSYASPVIAGFLGLIRSKYPELNARQAIEFARLCVDDISDFNSAFTYFLPGRVNMLKAAQTTPFSLTAITPQEIHFLDSQGNTINRLTDNSQIINLKIDAFNYLGAANNLKFKLEFYGNADSISLINPEISISEVPATSPLVLEGFQFILTGEQPDLAALKVVIYKDDKKIDYFIIPLIVNNDLTTFSNNKIIFDISDYGRFGSSVNTKTEKANGFSPKTSFNLLYKESGLILTIDEIFAYSSLYGDYYKGSDFKPIKRFTGAENNVGSFSVVNSSGYNIIVNSKYEFISPDLPIVKCDYNIENLSDEPVDNLAMGLLLDWDMPISIKENSSELFLEAIPDEASLVNTAAQLITNSNNSEYCGVLVFSKEQGAIVQSAGFRGSDAYSNETIKPLLTNGTEMQYIGKTDIKTSSGIKFLGNFPKNTSKSFTIFIAYSQTKSELASLLKLAYNTNSVEVELIESVQLIYPNPTKSTIYISGIEQPDTQVELYGINGVQIDKSQYSTFILEHENLLKLEIQSLPTGKYFLKLNNKFHSSFIKE